MCGPFFSFRVMAVILLCNLKEKTKEYMTERLLFFVVLKGKIIILV